MFLVVREDHAFAARDIISYLELDGEDAHVQITFRAGRLQASFINTVTGLPAVSTASTRTSMWSNSSWNGSYHLISNSAQQLRLAFSMHTSRLNFGSLTDEWC